MHAFRRRGQRATILYWFRSPPNVKVGRAALDEDAIRALEETHPDLIFDWPQILQTPVRSDRPFEEPRPARVESSRRPVPAPTPRPIPRSVHLASAIEEIVDEAPPRAETPAPAVSDQTMIAPSSASDPELLTASNSASDPKFAVGHEVSVSHPSGILNSEHLSVLRARYAELSARLSERITDPVRLESLREQAAKLDPDAWVTAQEVRHHLEDYELVYQALRTALGQGSQRRSRRGGVRHRQAHETPVKPSGSGEPEGS